MLEKSAKRFMEEIRLAKVFRDAHLVKQDEMYDRFAGEAYRDDCMPGWSENHPYEFLRLTTSSVVHYNPRTRVKSRRGGNLGLIARAMQMGLNRWCHDIDLRQILKRAYRNMCFDFGVVQVVNAEQSWMDPRARGNAWWPECHLIDSDKFFFDPLCQTFETARYSGHDFIRDKEDLLAEAQDNPDAGWNRDAIESLSEDVGIEEYRGERRKYEGSRNEIVLHEVWVPEYHLRDPQDGYNGAILTVAEGADSNGKNPEWIREPRAYYGPRTGPYVMFGAYSVPNDPYPLSPFQATWKQLERHNQIAEAVHEAIVEYKKIVLHDASAKDLGKAIVETPNSFVRAVRGMSDARQQAVQLEFGGITPQHIAQQDYSQTQMDRNTGINQTQRGNLTGSTATEISVAEEAKNMSLAHIKQEFNSATTKVLESAGHYMYHDDRVAYPLGEDAQSMFQPTQLVDGSTIAPDPWFVGGSFVDGSGGRYGDLELEIEPYSMERTNDAMARSQYMQLVEMAISMGQAMPMMPWVNMKLLADKGGDALNDREFGQLFNPDLAAAMAGMPGTQPGPPQTQFSKQSSSSSTTQGQQRGQQLAGLMGGGKI